MARSHGKVLAAIWVDPDWLRLTGAAQRLYILLLSQSTLTLAGSLDLRPKRWSQLCSDTPAREIYTALEELERAGFVVTDTDTDELVIRSFTVHDMPAGRANSNLLKGLWSAWCGIGSAKLRDVVIHSMPADLWSKALPFAPPTVEQIRRSTPSKPDVQTTRSNGPSEPVVETERRNPLPTPVLPTAVVDRSEPPTASEIYRYADEKRKVREREYAPKVDSDEYKRGMAAARAVLEHNGLTTPGAS